MISGFTLYIIVTVSVISLVIMNISLLICQLRVFGNWSKIIEHFPAGNGGKKPNEFSEIMRLYKSHQLNNSALLKYLRIYSFTKWICYVGFGLIFIPPIIIVIFLRLLKLFGAG